MSKPRTQQIDHMCSNSETSFMAFAQCRLDPSLRHKRIEQVFTDLVKLSEVNLSTEKLRGFVNDWHKYLDQATSSKPRGVPNKYFLTAFSLAEDHTLTLTQETLNELVQAISDREGIVHNDALREAKRRADVGRAIRGDKEYELDKEIWGAIDILAVIIKLMNGVGLKPFVRDPDLQGWIVFFSRSRASITLGGAAGNEAYILRRIGLPVLVYSPYHHTNQADAAPICAKRLVFDEAGPVLPYPSLNEGNPNDARRFSFVLQLTPTQDENGNIGPTLIVDDMEIRPTRNDRVILRVPMARTDNSVTWKRLRVVWNSSDIELDPVAPTYEDPTTLKWDAKTNTAILEIDRRARIRTVRNGHYEWKEVFKGLVDGEWPHLSVFQHHPTVDADGILIIELVPANKLEALANNVQAVLLGGIQMFGQTMFTETLTELLRAAWIGQLKALGSKGASLHVELSDVTSGQVLSRLSDLCQEAGIRHISTNREELVQITSEPGTPYFVSRAPGRPESPFGTFLRAVHLLKALRLDTYYVHDLELDILVRRNHPNEDASVIATTLKRHRQAMLLAKASVPEALLRRAQVDQEWDLILSTESLGTLLVFAEEYTNYVDTTIKGVEKASILEQVLRTGYYQHPDTDGISVVVAPTIYVSFDQKVSLVGAGDMCFASHAAASSS